MIWEIILTAVILAVAALWAGRRLWRAWGPHAVSDGNSGCGGGCDGCAMDESAPQQLHDLPSPARRDD